ncbi:MAG: methionyl-tRNA formyltransferase [Candidatus Neomarinimicrobiota bacterium]
MRLIFMGNPEFAVPSLRRLVAFDHDLAAVVTSPDRPVGRGRRLQPTAVAAVASELNLPLLQPDSLRDPDFHQQLTELHPDLLVVVAFRILPQTILTVPTRGTVNLHGSLLPRYRGAAPIQRALINGDSSTGLTTFLVEPSIDTGNILDQIEVPITADDDYGSLAERMSRIGADLLEGTIARLQQGVPGSIRQNEQLVTRAPKITRELCHIDWQATATEIHNLIRGLAPEPAAFTILGGQRLKIFRSAVTTTTKTGEPGLVLQHTDEELVIQTGRGALAILECQLEGKRRLLVTDFLRGSPVKAGDRLK